MKNKYLNPRLSILVFDEEDDILTTSSTDEKHAVHNSTETVTSSVNVKMSDIVSLN